MASKKYLGKIIKVDYGFDSDGRFGLNYDLSFEGRGTTLFNGIHGVELIYGDVPRLNFDNPATWSHEADAHTHWLAQLLFDAKKRKVQDLVGTPIEVVVDENTVISWRVLTEVL